jgi:hypothetical protein
MVVGGPSSRTETNALAARPGASADPFELGARAGCSGREASQTRGPSESDGAPRPPFRGFGLTVALDGSDRLGPARLAAARLLLRRAGAPGRGTSVIVAASTPRPI